MTFVTYSQAYQLGTDATGAISKKLLKVIGEVFPSSF